MNFLTTDVKQLYKKYLTASMSSAVAMSIYSFVDTIAVGQSEGKLGTAAMAIITPLYGCIVVLAILIGIGGSIMMSKAKGEGNEEKGNACFTASLIAMTGITVFAWILLGLFHEQILTFFGANAEIYAKTMEYAGYIIKFFPIFIMPTFLGAFVRNDGNPNLAMAAVLIGGSINILGDYFLVFPMHMGMKGAAVATVLGTTVQAVIMGSHFLTKKCNLKLAMPHDLNKGMNKIIIIGFGAGVLDLGNIVINILMNRQIMSYGTATELSVYGVIATISSLLQALFCGVGQAIQPIVSANYGAGNTERISKVWKLSMKTVVVMGTVFLLVGELFPAQIINVFMSATPEIIEVAKVAIRLYFVLFLALGITVTATYYMQSVLNNKYAMIIAILRSIVLSSAMIIILPLDNM